MIRTSTLMLTTAALLAAGHTGAAVIYVDASTSNTTHADGSAFTPVVSASAIDNDDWEQRPFANNGTIFASNGTGAENAPKLATTISGLSAGTTYEVYAYFWGVSSNNWRGRASLINTASLPLHNTGHFAGSGASAMTAVTNNITGGLNPGPITTADGSGIENGGYFANTVLTEESNRALYQVSFGQAVAADDGNGGGEIIVYIDDFENQASSSGRTWYDGVGYEIVPEPGSLALLTLGGLLIARRRRG